MGLQLHRRTSKCLLDWFFQRSTRFIPVFPLLCALVYSTATAGPVHDADSPLQTLSKKPNANLREEENQRLEIAQALASGDSRLLVMLAKKLIVDSFPEDRKVAENLLIHAIRVNPHDIQAFADLARFTLWQISSGLKEPGEIQTAMSLAQQVADMAADRPMGEYLLCEILLTMGKSAQANALYQKTLAQFPNHIDSMVFEARYWSEVDPQRALGAALAALGMGHPMDDLSPAIALALVNRQKQMGAPAGQALLRFAEVYPDRWLYHRAALAMSEQGDYVAAREAYLKAIALGNHLESRLQLGILEYTKLAEPLAGVMHLQQTLDAFAGKLSVEDESLALVHGHLALAQLRANNVTESRNNIMQTVELSANLPSVLIPFVQEFLRQEKGQWLLQALEKASEQYPENEFVHLSLATLASDRKDHSAAAAHYSNSIALLPERDDLFAARAHEYYKVKKYDLALQDFEQAIKLRSDHASHYYNRGCMLSLLGEYVGAIESIKTALAMDPALAETALTDQDLNNLRGIGEFALALTNIIQVTQQPAQNRSSNVSLELHNAPTSSASAAASATTKESP